MSASDQSSRRRIPVRLVDVPVELRLKAALDECRHAKTSRERDALIAAALDPKPTTFYVTDVIPINAAA